MILNLEEIWLTVIVMPFKRIRTGVIEIYLTVTDLEVVEVMKDCCSTRHHHLPTQLNKQINQSIIPFLIK
jgi:hypothetical protein